MVKLNQHMCDILLTVILWLKSPGHLSWQNLNSGTSKFLGSFISLLFSNLKMLLKYRDDDPTFLAVTLLSVELLLEGRGIKNLKHTPTL